MEYLYVAHTHSEQVLCGQSMEDPKCEQLHISCCDVPPWLVQPLF